MESLFGCNSAKSVQKEPTRRTILPHPEQENRVLDPKKSQNIAILLRALNVTRDEVTEALLDGKTSWLCNVLMARKHFRNAYQMDLLKQFRSIIIIRCFTPLILVHVDIIMNFHIKDQLA